MSERSGYADLLRYWGPVVAWMFVISTLSGDPFSASNTNRYIDPVLRYFFPDLSPAGFVLAHTVIRKTAHLTEFFILGCLGYWAMRRGRLPAWSLGRAAAALLLAMGFSLLDEFHQAFVPTRTASIIDSAVDSTGALLSQLVIYLRHTWHRPSGPSA